MIRKLASGKYRLYSGKKNPKTGRRRNLGTFNTRAAAEQHERAVQYFKRHEAARANHLAPFPSSFCRRHLPLRRFGVITLLIEPIAGDRLLG